MTPAVQTPCAATAAVDMAGPTGMALADDESRVFVVSPSDDAVAVFERNRSTGALEQLKMDPSNNKGGCTNEDGSDNCLDGHGLVGAHDVVSVGGNAYIAATGSNAIVTLTKDAQSGRWKELDNGSNDNTIFCISEGAVTGCRGDGKALAGATSITAVGSYVYVGGPGPHRRVPPRDEGRAQAARRQRRQGRVRHRQRVRRHLHGRHHLRNCRRHDGLA